MTAELHVLCVFVAPDGGHGNPLGVFVDGTVIARPGPDGSVEVGGRCALDDARPYP